MVRKFGGERVECAACKERVYPLEAVKFDSWTYHKNCMKCAHCDGKVGLKGLAMIGDKIYCKPHFKELFKQSGGSYDAISSAGSTDTLDSPTKSPAKKSTAAAAKSPSTADVPFSPTPKKPCVSAAGEKIVPPSEERTDESEFAQTLKSIKTKPRKRPSLIKVDVPKHENENEYAKTLKSIKTKKKESSKKPGDKVWKAVRDCDIEALRKALAKEGAIALFAKDETDATPIEVAFRRGAAGNSDSEACGRFMIDYLKDQIAR